jgi:hypothetical protein
MLDDQEMYEDQHAFKLDDFVKLARFTNHLCYRLITSQHSVRLKDPTWNSLKLLLLVLYRRDCRRKYCPDGHWLIESSKMTQLLCDIEKGKKNAKVSFQLNILHLSVMLVKTVLIDLRVVFSSESSSRYATRPERRCSCNSVPKMGSL